jgi:N-acetylglucosamine kinase-like BadF-type ATPase
MTDMNRSMPNWFDMLPAIQRKSILAMVDGGATASRAIIADTSGRVYGYAEGGPTNARSTGDDEAVDNLVKVIDRCAYSGQVRVADIDVCLITSAGVATVAHADLMSDALRLRLLQGSKTATVPDTLGCWAITANLSPAVVAISGTGSAVFSGDIAAGICKSYGNWDFLLGDEGSGFAIGRAALQEALRYSEGRSSADRIARICLEHFGLTDLQAIPDVVHKPVINKMAIAALARPILDEAVQGNPDAYLLVTTQAQLLADSTIAALEEMRNSKPMVGCFGGVFQNRVYLQKFQQALADRAGIFGIPMVPQGVALNGIFRLLLATGTCVPGSDDYYAAARQFDDELAESITASRR